MASSSLATKVWGHRFVDLTEIIVIYVYQSSLIYVLT